MWYIPFSIVIRIRSCDISNNWKLNAESEFSNEKMIWHDLNKLLAEGTMAKTAGRWGSKADFTNVRPKLFDHTHIFHKSWMFLLLKNMGVLCSTFGWGYHLKTPICRSTSRYKWVDHMSPSGMRDNERACYIKNIVLMTLTRIVFDTVAHPIRFDEELIPVGVHLRELFYSGGTSNLSILIQLNVLNNVCYNNRR